MLRKAKMSQVMIYQNIYNSCHPFLIPAGVLRILVTIYVVLISKSLTQHLHLQS